jgi:thioesterase domain-containing protein
MDIAAIPFNRLLGLQSDGFAVTLPEDAKYRNHLGTVHAGAQFSLAEAAGGQWLLGRFGEAAADYLAVVRRADVKYRRPAAGALTAKADVPPEEAERFRETLEKRGRASIEVRVEILGADGSVTLEAAFEWFAQRIRA